MRGTVNHGSGDVLPHGVALRVSPFPSVGSPELGRIHRDTQAALDRRLGNRQRPSLRVQLAQQLRKLVARLDP